MGNCSAPPSDASAQLEAELEADLQRIEELERGKINLRVQRLDDADEVDLVQSVQPFCL